PPDPSCCGIYREEKPAVSQHVDLCQSTTMYLYLLILLQLLSSAGASESGIVGGKIAKGYHVCGGMLIQEDFVLTSAHCLKDAFPLTVVLGAHDLTEEEKKSRQDIQVVHHHRHPLHRQYSQFSYDIMLLQVNFKTSFFYTFLYGIYFKCTVDYVHLFSFHNHTSVCLFSNSCCFVFQGDSGGPLICNNKAQGIVSYNYAESCGDSQYPHVYMKIPFFVPWIKEVLHGYGANMSLNKQA
uniref:Peptidase S1 domain-containing protein n=1 Tax=Hucho hucho TaxID=62062 RepID=A0A4W5K3W1_9TELE